MIDDDEIHEKRVRGRPSTASAEKKREDGRLRAAVFYEKKRIKDRCIKYANEQLSKIAKSTFAAESELHWTNFILWLNGAPYQYDLCVSIESDGEGDDSIDTTFDGLMRLILNGENIYLLE
jgi:hypothetical protein